FKQAFLAAGYTSSQYRIDNAQGSDSTQLSDATADINLGAKVLIVCPLDGPTGVAIAKLAEQKGVILIAFATGYNKVVFNQAAKSVAAGASGTADGAKLVAENFAPGWDNTKGGT